MESVLKDLDGVMVYLDDILVTGSNPEQHLKNLERVLERLQQANLTLKKQKCDFALSSVQYLGHIIDAQGLRPSPRKVEAVQAVPTPKNTSELKSYLGLIKYYMKFIPNLSTLLSPLHRLLNKGVKWTWTSEQQSAFEKSKESLQSAPVLIHFDPSKELLVAADASPYGIGGVLSHRMPNGDEQPIAYVSRTLSAAERNYSQLEKEGLAIVFAVKKFHQFLHGHRFTILSDHKPLKHLFAENRQTPTLACGRIQRWALLLNMYQYKIQHRPGKDMGNADALSRLPLPVTPEAVPAPGDHIILVNHLEDVAVTPQMIKSWTERDPVLSRVRRLVLEGWEDLGEDGAQRKPFQNRREELSVLDGCLLWGSRVIVPKPGQQAILDQLHDTHPGITKMKALARSYFWWPTIDTDIEQRVKECRVCQDNRPTPPTAPFHPWEWPNRAWSRLHIDHAGPYLGHTHLVVIDAHSKWLEVFVVNSTSAECTIQKLSSLFTTHGLPDQIVSDNGTGFSSQEFRDFTRTLGIRHTFTAPYHPSSNGLAERAVRTFKEGVAKLQGPIEKRIIQFLFRYRITPQSTTGTSPAELLLNRKLRSTLDLAHLDVARKVHQKQDLIVAPKE